MTLSGFAIRSVGRNAFRTVLTVIGVAVAVVTFVLLRTVLDAWTVGADYAAKDRVATRHKITFVSSLPLRYITEIRQIPGVLSSTYASWFGGKDPNHEDDFFATLAVETETVLSVYDDIQVPAEQVEAWKREPTGALVGDMLAKKMRWKVGDKVILRGTIYPGEWPFRISGVYTTNSKAVDRSQFVFHWKYLNESTAPLLRDQIGWVTSKVAGAGNAARVSAAIDKHFEQQEIQTLSMNERELNQSFLAMFSATLNAINIVSLVILLIMGLILGNTIAMGVRERTNEYGVLRAIGFLPKHLVGLVLGEAITVAFVGGAVGLVIAYPLINGGLGRWIEENMGGFFPYFRVSLTTAAMAMLLALTVGLIASVLPAFHASRLRVVDALRRVG